ncbi:MAG: hypothetical protein H6779_03515 [Candidatus Nomurabacteria bacterium]|nr:hypothetical protein [Candidatus Nomurabacteria bacterium]USN87455.1 MAG: hypothetical protein H6779_03515 [Candidatus Nomurabacteria bacterium]
MLQKLDSKIIGASVIGFAMVAGALVINNMNREVAQTPSEDASLAVVNEAPPRNFIEVKDSNDDGLEDWQEEFLSADKIVISSTTENYTPPTTITGQMGITLIRELLSSKVYAPFGSSNDEIVDDLVTNLADKANDKIYDQRDITVTDDMSDDSIRNYGNALAAAIIDNGVKGAETESVVLQRIINGQDDNGIEKLQTLADMYEKTLNDTLAILVPRSFVKEHLDLINVYNALFYDVDAMAKLEEDPALTLIRMKRYEDDVKGSYYAFQNVYLALEKHVEVFKENDPAIIFIQFSPDFKRQ